MPKRKRGLPRLTSEELLAGIGTTPADNQEGFSTAIPWKSRIGGAQVRGILTLRRGLDAVSRNALLYGPMAVWAEWQKQMLDLAFTNPLKRYAHLAVRTGKNPDLFGETNAWIYKSYARLLHGLCAHFLTEGRFDQDKAFQLTTTLEGQDFLKRYLYEFAFLEKNYSSLGLTRLHAKKDLLKSLLVVITETPLPDSELPFMRKNADGTDALSFKEYLAEGRTRFEVLYREDAFDIREYSERATGGMIGYLPYESVEGSRLYSVTLRHYLRTEGIVPNGKVLYLCTPLINKPELFDLARGKSVVEGMMKEGYEIYLVDHGEASFAEAKLGLAFYGKTLHDRYLEMITARHPGQEIYVMAYCMGGTLVLPYLARRAEERRMQGLPMDVSKVALMASPIRFDDKESGMGPMRGVIRRAYDPEIMNTLYGDINIPSALIETGMNEIQPGVQFHVAHGFYSRAHIPGALADAAPFIYWLTHGTRFPAKAHQEWIERVYLGNEIYKETYCLPSSVKELDGKAVNMKALGDTGVSIFSYRGDRDPIAPAGSCVASDLWGQVEDGNIDIFRGGMNRTIEKHVGHIFVVSKVLLAEYLGIVSAFFRGETVT